MKKIIMTVLVLVLFASNALSFQVASDLIVGQIDSRSGGNHSVILNGVPDENCSHSDRIVIDAATPGAQAMFATASIALLSNRTIEIMVNGCALIQIDNEYTAPKAMRISIR